MKSSWLLVETEIISAWLGRVTACPELLRHFQPSVFIDARLTIVGELVESHAGLVLGDIPELLEGDELITVDLTVAVLVRVGEGGLEESQQVLRNGAGGGDLGGNTGGPVGELSAVDLAIMIDISVVHQELEDLLLVADGLIVEVVAGANASGGRELGHDGLVVLKVDDAIAVHVISVLEEKVKFGFEKVSHLFCLKCERRFY